MSSFRVLEKFEASAKGDKTEDLIVETPHYIGVFDGVTGVRDWMHENKTMGQWAALLCAEALSELAPDATVEDFAATATQKLADARRKFNLTPHDRLAASAIVLPRRKPLEIWSIGDCHYAFRLKDGSWYPRAQNKYYDSVTLAYRQIVASQEILAKGMPATAEERGALSRTARQSIHEALDKQMLFANHPDENEKLGFGVLSGTPVPAHHVYGFRLPDTTAEIVLCSDGFPEPTETAAEGKAMIAELREADPFLIGKNRLNFLGAKGFVQFDGSIAEWYDDVSYIRIAV